MVDRGEREREDGWIIEICGARRAGVCTPLLRTYAFALADAFSSFYGLGATAVIHLALALGV